MKSIKKLMPYSLCIMLACVSCMPDNQRLKFVCTCNQMDEVQDFMKTTIKDANNMADEEMEDVIDELRKTAISINCTQKLIWVDHHGWYLPEKNTLDSCETVIGGY